MEKTSLDIAARRFLNGKSVHGVSEADLASACNQVIQQMAQRSLKKAGPLARKFAEHAAQASPILQLAAWRALARVSHMSGTHAEAREYYLKARKMCSRDPLTRARIDRALIDVYMYLGDFSRARLAARSAAAVFTRMGADDDVAQTQVNLANLLHRQDRHREAEFLYRKAGDHFISVGNGLAAARCQYNRANTLVQLFEIPEAERLYQQAMTAYTAAGYELDACDARYGLAWLWMLTGRFHSALVELAACEKMYREGGDPRGEMLCQLDRAEVYLGLGMYLDSLRTARAAERGFNAMKLGYETSKAALFRAYAASALGHRSEALQALQTANYGFAAQKNHGFLGAARILAADLAGADRLRRHKELAASRAHFSRAQLPYWEAICDAHDATEPDRISRSMQRLRANPAVRWIPHLYALRQVILGDQAYRRGRVADALRRWSNAADRLDAVRALLPPIELRNAFGKRHTLPHPRLIAAELDKRPLEAAAWSERYKTAGLWAPLAASALAFPARRSAQESLEKLSSHVGALTRHLWNVQGARGSFAPASRRQLGRLQRRARGEIIALESNKESTLPSSRDLARLMAKTSRRMTAVQFHIDGNDIIAFVHRNGHATVRRFTGGMARLTANMQKWRFILESELLAAGSDDVTVPDTEHTLWADLGAWLWQPLEIADNEERVLIIPEGELANLPWPALIVDGVPLIEKLQIILSPSFRHYSAAVRTKVNSQRIDIFRGVTDNLPGAELEIDAVAHRAGAAVTIHHPCRRENWPSSGEAFIWHFVGHADMRSDNPFYSCLYLDDGPLFAADFRLKECRVDLVTLAACRSGEQVSLPGEESTGLVRSLLEMGARNIIAGRWPVSDRSAACWMDKFYGGLFDGAGIPMAMRQASLTVRDRFPSAYHWAAFAVFGAGDIGGKYEG